MVIVVVWNVTDWTPRVELSCFISSALFPVSTVLFPFEGWVSIRAGFTVGLDGAAIHVYLLGSAVSKAGRVGCSGLGWSRWEDSVGGTGWEPGRGFCDVSWFRRAGWVGKLDGAVDFFEDPGPPKKFEILAWLSPSLRVVSFFA